MAMPNAPLHSGSNKRRPDPVPPDQALQAPHKGWPFAKGSQNHQDETSAPWPRPASRLSTGQPRPTAPEK